MTGKEVAQMTLRSVTLPLRPRAREEYAGEGLIKGDDSPAFRFVGAGTPNPHVSSNLVEYAVVSFFKRLRFRLFL